MPDYPPGYSRIREQIGIDPAALDAEVIQHPPLVMEICEFIADACEERDKAINELHYAKSSLIRDLRENVPEGKKRLTNDEIDAIVTTDKFVIKSQDRVAECERDVRLWNGLLEGFRAKGSSLKRLGELMHAGYSATSSVIKTPREHINEARESVTIRKRQSI